MNPLTLFGLFAVTAMLVCYALENRSRWFILAFAAACALAVRGATLLFCVAEFISERAMTARPSES
jgi:hypothetical protein